MEWYAVAEKHARALVLRADDTLDTAMGRWLVHYTGAQGYDPCQAETNAARAVLGARLTTVPDPPPSDSGLAWDRVPDLVTLGAGCG